MQRLNDTIAALATPVGTSAIALIRISGPASASLAREIFGALSEPRTVGHGDYLDREGRIVDDVLHTYFAGPNSYTGEDSLEISCHGNPYIARRILEDLLARGCRSAGPGEFTQRAFLNGRMDLSQAEAVMDIIHARSERALAEASRQLRGSLGRRMKVLTDGLLQVLAHIEAYIDFPEEDLPPENRELLLNDLARLTADVGKLLATNHYGEMLRNGIKTVIVGAPNAGKSSVLNRLVGRDRALVSAEPGTTRDYLEERILLGAHALQLVDTAGLNPSPVPLERLGIEKSIEQALGADLYLVVIDHSIQAADLPSEVADKLSDKNAILVLNKSDLPPSPEPLSPALARLPSTHLSALTGDGFESLCELITKQSDAFQLELGEESVAINARHANALSRAASGLQAAMAKLQDFNPIELIASDLRSSLSAFGEISGRIDNERVLDRIFSTFCIGK